MVTCIAGMHRSGTSMVARLLNLCGLDLGPADDLLPPNAGNPAGYWENRHFVALNDALLDATGGCWDAPPAQADAYAVPDLAALRGRAMALVAGFDDRVCWGWKDPRNALTLPFWRQRLPGLKIVVCVRHPLEVAGSLRRRGDARADAGVDLWLRYHRRLLATVGAEGWIVTHYDAYFHDPAAELRRVGTWLGLDVAETTICRATRAVRDDLRHERVAVDPPAAIDAPDVSDCYRELCAAAGPVLRAAHAGQPSRGDAPASSERGARFLSGILRQRAGELEARIAAREEELGVLLDRAAGLEESLRAVAMARAASDAAAAAWAARAEAAESQMEDITRSRGWRLLQWLWRFRLGVAPLGSRRERLWVGLTGVRRRAPEHRRIPATARSPR